MHRSLLRIALGLCIAALAPHALQAQAQPVAVGVDVRDTGLLESAPSSRAVADTTRHLRDPRTRAGRVGLRVVGSFLVAVPGAYLGAVAGRPTLPDHCNGCDDPGLEPTVVGGIIGAVTASALLAGSLRLGDRCSTRSRLSWALVGAASGGGTVIATLYSAHHDGRVTGAALLSVPLAALLPALTSTICESR